MAADSYMLGQAGAEAGLSWTRADRADGRGIPLSDSRPHLLGTTFIRPSDRGGDPDGATRLSYSQDYRVGGI